LRPPAGVDLSAAEAVVGKLHVMVAMDGNAKAGKWLEHVTPRGLTFRHSGREGRWRHFEGAAVRMAGGVRHCRVDRCRFAGLGGVGRGDLERRLERATRLTARRRCRWA